MMIFMMVDDVVGSNHDYELDDNGDKSDRIRILNLGLFL